MRTLSLAAVSSLSALAIIIAAATLDFGPPAPLLTAQALEGSEGVGIVVKNGSKMDQVLAGFTQTEVACDPAASSTPQPMCPVILYEGRAVKVFYTAPLHLTTSQSPFKLQLGAFPFAGSVEYKNQSESDSVIEQRLIRYMHNSGVGDDYSIIYEP